MEYALYFIAFVAVVVGVLGKTHNDRIPGPAGVRPLGWLLVGMGFVTLLISGFITYGKQKALDEARAERLERLKNAKDQIQRALIRTFEGLNLVYRADIGGGNFARLEDLKDPEFVNFLESFDTLTPLRDPQYLGATGKPTVQLMEQLTDAGLSDFDTQIASFKDLLPADVVSKAYELRDDRRYNMFRRADVAIWVDNAVMKTKKKHYSDYIIDPDPDPDSRKTNEEYYIDFISEAIQFERALKEATLK
jgi:hypothetical protein